MDSEVTIDLGRLSQILVAVGSPSYQVEHILTTVKSLSTSLETTNEPKSQVPQKDLPYQIAEEIDNLGTTSDGEQSEIEKFSTCLTTNTTCIREINNTRDGGLHNMMKGGEYQYYIESWFQKVTEHNTIPSFNTF